MPSGVPRTPSAAEWVLKKRCTRCGETKPWAKFPPRKYWPDGTVRIVASHCSACDAAISRVRMREIREAKGEQYVRHERRRKEWQRRRRAQLAAERTSGGRRLSSGPVTALIRRAVEEEGEIAVVAEQCRMQDRILRRVMAQEHVTLRLADEICTRLGVRLYDVYPELEEVAA